MKKFAATEAGEAVSIAADDVHLEGNLTLPHGAHGVVLFAHGSGSSRFSPRNRYVAEALNERRLGTLLIDLLSEEEESVDIQTTHLRFDLAFLASRLLHAIDWLKSHHETRDLGIGLFGSSTGGGAALVAAAEKPDDIAAVVSRGGRPDLAGSALPLVQCPTLFIVGGNDTQVIELNRQAFQHLRCKKETSVVARASHLFEEPGALEEVARLAGDWFSAHLR